MGIHQDLLDVVVLFSVWQLMQVFFVWDQLSVCAPADAEKRMQGTVCAGYLS